MLKTSGVYIWPALHKASSIIEAHALRSIAKLEMCHSDFAVLEALMEQGPLPVNTIGKGILLTSGSITTAIDRLEARGLVQRQWQQDDKRVCAVQLTDAGRTLIEKSFIEYAKAMETAAAGLSHPERRTLLNLLRQLDSSAEGMLREKPQPSAEKKIVEPKKPITRDESTPREVMPAQPEEETGFSGFTGLD